MAGEPRHQAPPKEEQISMSFEPPAEHQKIQAEKVDEKLEYDEFGLPIKRRPVVWYDEEDIESDDEEVKSTTKHSPNGSSTQAPRGAEPEITSPPPPTIAPATTATTTTTTIPSPSLPQSPKPPTPPPKYEQEKPASPNPKDTPTPHLPPSDKPADVTAATAVTANNRLSLQSLSEKDRRMNEVKMFSEAPDAPHMNLGSNTISEYSHQKIVPRANEPDDKKDEPEPEDEWQTMPAYASHDMWDDDGRLIAKAIEESDDEDTGAAKGYTRVFDDEDADSVTSMDENTKYLFNDNDDDEASRNPLNQMQATKELLTEGQRIAYVGVCKLAVVEMTAELVKVKVKGRGAKRNMQVIVENMRMWSQKIMVRLYTHMEISPPEQIMIEQLAEHGVLPSDLTPTLMVNARVDNPMHEQTSSGHQSPSASTYGSKPGTPINKGSTASFGSPRPESPPPYDEDVELQEVKDPAQLPSTKTLDIDLRWTVLCDLFLVLIADSIYDARARTLLEHVGEMLGVPWLEICKFEKRVTDALEMQESTEQNWAQNDHIEVRDKQARNKRYMMLGLATVGGGLVIGLSGGLLAPAIGMGLAAGFTTIGVAGTTGFLGGTAATAIIATGATVSGSYVGGKAGFNRMKSVQTFEFKPLHNAKRVNLIITVSGWMNGKVDDVRLPFSTVDPIMGDLFSIHWEPEMLRSMGQTINILATEVLTQSLQQVLGSTILISLMASLQLPVVLTKLAYLLDNPWSVSLERAQGAGLILADTLINRNLGVRPVTLVGYSLGARVIYYCLRELARVGASGLVQNVYMFGTPIVVKKDDYAQAVSVVSGRVVNGYASNDWILGYLFRATSGGIGRVAGLAAVTDIPGVENVDVTELVPGHMAYRQAMPKVLRHVGWEVTSDEFSEIEDPDPENHQVRQRELINELEEARREMEKQPQKKKLFGLFARKQATKKADWETYEPAAAATGSKTDDTADGPPASVGANDGVLFDIDAIRAEIAREEKGVEVKEIETTLPKLRISSDEKTPVAQLRHDSLRQTKSYNDVSSDSALSPPPGSKSQFSTPSRNTSNSYGYAAAGAGVGVGAGAAAATAWGYDEYNEFEDGESCELSFEPEPPAKLSFEPPPPLATRYTEPPAYARNVWDDDDDDEFAVKEEGEMTLSFA